MKAYNFTDKNRVLHLDGIRGVAALAVALFHFARAFDNSLLSGSNPINKTPISTLWNGHFAVALFFVLSGLLFFEKFQSSNITKGTEAAIKRFLRLSIPIMSICLTAYLFHKLGLFTNQGAALISGSDWLARWYRFDPDITLAITESLWFDFVAFDPMRTYNSNLWTISYELLAVIGVIYLAIALKNLNIFLKSALLIFVIALCYGTHYFEFALGAGLALALTLKKNSVSTLAASIIIATSLSISALVSPYQVSSLASDLLYPVGAVLLIAAVSINHRAKKVFSNYFFVKLGEISFGLYLMHFLTINSVTASVYTYTKSLSLTFVSYAISTLVLATGFTYLIDQPWTRLLNKSFRNLRPKTSASHKTEHSNS